MTSYGFQPSQANHTLFYKHSKEEKVAILIVYVDDMILVMILTTRKAQEETCNRL